MTTIQFILVVMLAIHGIPPGGHAPADSVTMSPPMTRAACTTARDLVRRHAGNTLISAECVQQ
jgi:hypothetical protein